MSKLVDHGEESIRTISLTERPAGAVLSVGVTPDHRVALIRCGMATAALDVAGVTDMITALKEVHAILGSTLTTGEGSRLPHEYRHRTTRGGSTMTPFDVPARCWL